MYIFFENGPLKAQCSTDREERTETKGKERRNHLELQEPRSSDDFFQSASSRRFRICHY
jgi:hypothetical protein